jgi:hypothetical protein
MKKFFAKIVLFLHTLFTNLNEWIYDHVQPSIEVVERIKNIVDSVIGDVIVAVIPGDADDKLRLWISDNLSKALVILRISADIINEPDTTQKVFKLAQYLKTLSPAMRSAVYMKLASEMSKASGGKDTVKGHSVDLLVQLQFSKMKEGVSHEDFVETKSVEKPVVKAVAKPVSKKGK